jgi:ABC-type Fe3+-siderophore transport system permease subunit
MNQNHIDYANNQMSYLFSQPRYLISIVALACVGVSGFVLRMILGEDYAYLSFIGLCVTFGGSTLIALRIHKKSVNQEDRLMDDL